MTITHSSFHIEMDEIISEINRISKNMFIEKYVTIPDISVLRLKMLNISLYHASIPKPVRKVYCVTTGLIQIGLDLHETISNSKESNEKDVRNRQLSILAGDFYSSKYYYLLSENGLTEEIKKLAIGIKDINVAKMNLYSIEKGNDSIASLINLVKVRESSLYIQFLDKINPSGERKLWRDTIEDLIFLFNLADELKTKNIYNYNFKYLLIKNLANSEERKEISEIINSTDNYQNKIKYLYHKYDIQRRMEDIILDTYTDLTKKIKLFDNRFIQSELSYMLSYFTNTFHVFNAVEKA